MYKRGWMCLTLGLWMALGSTLLAEEISLIDQYTQERMTKTGYERFLYAKEILQNTHTIEVIEEAIGDMLRYASNRGEDEQARLAIETAVDHLPYDGNAWREAMLARGKIMTRLGRKDEAETFFQDAIQNNWHHAMLRYSESLIDCDLMTDACILECQRIAGFEKYIHYRGEEESLEIFITLLRLTKNHDASISLVAEVSEKLDSIADKPVYCRIAQALCLAEDGDISPALSILEELNLLLSEKKDHREYPHLPLYKASILYQEGRDYPAAEAAFSAYMIRNEGKNKKLVTSALRLARDIAIQTANRPKVDEFLNFVINTEWFQNESVREELSDDDIASMYDLQMTGMNWSGKYDESAAICKYVFTHFPKTLAAGTCLRYYASYIGWHDQDEAGAIRIYTDILTNSPHASAQIGALCALSRIAFDKKDYDTALKQCQEALNRMGIYAKGDDGDHRKKTEDFLQEIIRARAASRSDRSSQ